MLTSKGNFFKNAYKTNEKSMIFTFRGSKLGAKTYQKPWFCMEIVPKRFQDTPRRPQDAPKMRQDAPRRPKDGPRPPRGRARTAPRRRQTPQDGSKMVPRGARDGPRRPQIREKKGPKAIRSTIPSRPSFWSVFGRILGGFRVDSGWFWG